jgi:hypothetical protein
MNHKINAKVGFGCQVCGGTNLYSNGAVRCDDDQIYLLFICADEKCAELIPIKVDELIVQLYTNLPAPGSNMVN